MTNNMVLNIEDKEHLIKILKSLINIKDPDILKFTIESLIESIEEQKDE